MKHTVWKFTVPIDDKVHAFPMPIGARITFVGRSAQNTDRDLSFWAEVSPNAETRDRCFRVIGTGHSIGPGESLIATHADQAEYLVWHLLERVS